jgi:hypothetical protein
MKICPLLPHSELLASNYWGNRFAQEVGEVTICCVGIYVNDVYAVAAYDSCMCT